MIKKLIGLELKFRGKTIGFIFAEMIILTIIMRLLNLVYRENLFFDGNNNYVYLIGISLYIAIMAFSVFYIFSSSITDFSRRYFGDQGYLTHTLPAKVSQLLTARLIVDLIISAIGFIIALYALDTMYYDSSLIDAFFGEIMYWSNDTVLETIENITFIIVFFTTVFAFFAFLLWNIYAAYSLGQTCSQNKKAWSILFYVIIIICILILFGLLESVLGALISTTIDENGIKNYTIWSITGILTNVLSFAFFFGMIGFFKATVARVFKNKLNLE